MNDAVVPYTLPEVNDHSFFFISQHVAPHVEAPLHRHEAWELYYVTQGRGTRITGDTAMPFAEGDVVLIPPSMPHCWKYDPASADSSGEIRYLMVAFSPDFIDRSMADFPEIKNLLYGRILPSEALRYGHASATAIRSSLHGMEALDELGRLCSMLRLLPAVFTSDDHTFIGKPIKIERDIRRLQQVAEYVMAHYTHRIALDDIAAHIGMNRSAFCSFFKRNKGTTFSQFVTQYRLTTACGLLRDTHRQVSEIGYAVGFNDLPHFNRVFRKAYGTTPSEHRHALRENATDRRNN